MLCKKFIEFLSVTNDLGSFLESDNAGLVRIPGIMMHSNDITSTTLFFLPSHQQF